MRMHSNSALVRVFRSIALFTSAFTVIAVVGVSAAEAAAKAAGYDVRKSKVEGSCYEVYGVKDGKLFELFYSPEDLSLKHTKAK